MVLKSDILTVRDCPKRNRLSTRVSLGILNTILTLSGSLAEGSGGRHSDFLSFSSSRVWGYKIKIDNMYGVEFKVVRFHTYSDTFCI